MFQQRAADADAPMTAVQAEVSFAFDRLRDALASAALADPALFDRATARIDRPESDQESGVPTLDGLAGHLAPRNCFSCRLPLGGFDGTTDPGRGRLAPALGVCEFSNSDKCCHFLAFPPVGAN